MENEFFRFDLVGKYVKNKHRNVRTFISYMLSKTAQMFHYENLPDTIPSDILELFLQTNGNVFWYKHNDEVYIFTGGLGGKPDVYYRPTKYVISNPALGLTAQPEINVDGVLMKNDLMMEGLLPLLEKYGALLAEADITMNSSMINMRQIAVISAHDDKTVQSANNYIDKLAQGEMAIITENQLLVDGVKVQPTPYAVGTAQDIREQYQYYKSLLYSDLGLKTSHNMKREYVSEEENIVNDDTLIPFVDNMLKHRKEAIERVNEMFDLNITVELNGTWFIQSLEMELEEDILEHQIEEEIYDEESKGSEAIGEDQDVEGSEETEDTEAEDNEEDSNEEGNEGNDNDVTIEVNVNINTEEEVEHEEEDQGSDSSSERAVSEDGESDLE